MEPTFDKDNFIASGHIIDGHSREECTLHVQDGEVSIDSGISNDRDFSCSLVYDMVNAHTHCGDYGLKVPKGLSLEELVAPPDGLKHRYLSCLDENGLKDNMTRFGRASADYGSAGFIDFREGGYEGCRLLRGCCEDAVILGRPTSAEYDPEEVARILSIADGIGLPSLSDMSLEYIEAIADDVRDARKIFAIHASERIREDIDTILSLDPAFVVHMCEAADDDLAKCAEAEVPIVVCPTSNAYFGKEAPVVRMMENGVEVAIGTDNGMLCEPDLITECANISKIIKKQGGDPEDSWSMLSSFACKLLYHTSRMVVKTSERYLTVIPDTSEMEADGHIGPTAPFRIKVSRV